MCQEEKKAPVTNYVLDTDNPQTCINMLSVVVCESMSVPTITFIVEVRVLVCSVWNRNRSPMHNIFSKRIFKPITAFCQDDMKSSSDLVNITQLLDAQTVHYLLEYYFTEAMLEQMLEQLHALRQWLKYLFRAASNT